MMKRSVSPDHFVNIVLINKLLIQHHAFQTYYTAGPALLKFVYMDLPNGSYFGAIDTFHTNQPFIPLTVVSDSNRYLLWSELNSGLITSETPDGNVYDAVDTVVQVIQAIY